MKRLLLPLLVLIAFMGVYANQHKVKISGGFFTGKDYQDMSDTERRAYATGAINGMLVAPLFGAPEDNLTWLKNCTGKMSDEQIAAILAKHINDRPSQLESPLNVLTFDALQATCRTQNR